VESADDDAGRDSQFVGEDSDVMSPAAGRVMPQQGQLKVESSSFMSPILAIHLGGPTVAKQRPLRRATRRRTTPVTPRRGCTRGRASSERAIRAGSVEPPAFWSRYETGDCADAEF
jgi:hypothetical protein